MDNNIIKFDFISKFGTGEQVATNGPFAAAGWGVRERKLGKSTKDY